MLSEAALRCVSTLRAEGTARPWFVSSTQSIGTWRWSVTSITWAADTSRSVLSALCPSLRCCWWLNPFLPPSPQVYKATGEEFLKIAGGQISDFFFLSSFHSILAKRLSVNAGWIWLSRMFEEEQEPSTFAKEQLASDWLEEKKPK